MILVSADADVMFLVDWCKGNECEGPSHDRWERKYLSIDRRQQMTESNVSGNAESKLLLLIIRKDTVHDEIAATE